VQECEQRDRNRLGEVQQSGGLGEDVVGVADIGVDVLGGAFPGAGEQRAGVGKDDRVLVDVDDPGLGRDGLGDLVGVACGGDVGADVEELPDACPAGEVADGAAEERPVGLGAEGYVRPDLDRCVGGGPVGGVVVLTAELVIVHTLDAAGMVCE